MLASHFESFLLDIMLFFICIEDSSYACLLVFCWMGDTLLESMYVAIQCRLSVHSSQSHVVYFNLNGKL